MKDQLKKLLQKTIASEKILDSKSIKNLEIEISRSMKPEHGDFSSNIALKLSKGVGLSPFQLATSISNSINKPNWLKKTEVAQPGFINFFIGPEVKADVLISIIDKQSGFGSQDPGSKESILLEFVSSNPTGPLHVGHGRHAAFGDSLAKLLRKAGHLVETEYYINDAGRQIDILALSVLIEGVNLSGDKITPPKACYQGQYIKDVAKSIDKKHFANINNLSLTKTAVKDFNEDEEIDVLVSIAKNSIGEDIFERVTEIVCQSVLQTIKKDLGDFGVEYDHWFSEKNMIKKSKINKVVKHLAGTNSLLKKDGATWLKTTNYGDDKDRVIIREDGRSTYFASDISYHADKKARGFDKLINILGSDHHGYIARLKAGLASMEYDPEDLEVILMQFVALYRGKKKIKMSTRSGNFVPMRDLYEEVGVDATRFFYTSRSNEQHLDFDLVLATQQNNQNPVYYIQYANARICSVIQEIEKKGFKNNPSLGKKYIGKLNNKHELELISLLQNYPDVINQAAEKRSVHQLSNYLKDLAQIFHSYYGAQKFVVADDETRNPMVLLLQCVSIVIVDGLKILGVSAPKKM